MAGCRGNIFASVPKGLAEEEVMELARGGQARVERIVSCGQASPPGFWYDQDEAEFVALLAGEATVEFACGSAVRLRPGDWLDIAAHTRHRVAHTSAEPPAVWLAVHYQAS
jgi:cupin 2 domain-containing protein